jgi:hypothetical protein
VFYTTRKCCENRLYNTGFVSFVYIHNLKDSRCHAGTLVQTIQKALCISFMHFRYVMHKSMLCSLVKTKDAQAGQ